MIQMSEEGRAKIEALFEQIKKDATICSKQCPPKEVFICWCGYTLYSEKGFNRHLEMHIKHKDYEVAERRGLTNSQS